MNETCDNAMSWEVAKEKGTDFESGMHWLMHETHQAAPVQDLEYLSGRLRSVHEFTPSPVWKYDP